MIFSKQKLKVNRVRAGKHGVKWFDFGLTVFNGMGFFYGEGALVPWFDVDKKIEIDAKEWGTTLVRDSPAYGIYEKCKPLLEKWLREHTPNPKDIIREALTQKFKTPLIEAPSQEEMRQRKKWDEQLSMESQIEPFPPAFKIPGAIYLK